MGEVGVFDAVEGDGPLSLRELLWSQDLQKEGFLLLKQTISPHRRLRPACFMALKMLIKCRFNQLIITEGSASPSASNS